jgi:hypothetical protein
MLKHRRGGSLQKRIDQQANRYFCITIDALPSSVSCSSITGGGSLQKVVPKKGVSLDFS